MSKPSTKLVIERGGVYATKMGLTAICIDPAPRWQNRPLPVQANPVVSRLGPKWTEASIAELLVVEPWVKGEGWAPKMGWPCYALGYPVTYANRQVTRWIPRALHRSHLETTVEAKAAKLVADELRRVRGEEEWQRNAPLREEQNRQRAREKRSRDEAARVAQRRHNTANRALRALGLNGDTNTLSQYAPKTITLTVADVEALIRLAGAEDELLLATMAL